MADGRQSIDNNEQIDNYHAYDSAIIIVVGAGYG
jgi:hypothetical protein